MGHPPRSGSWCGSGPESTRFVGLGGLVENHRRVPGIGHGKPVSGTYFLIQYSPAAAVDAKNDLSSSFRATFLIRHSHTM